MESFRGFSIEHSAFAKLFPETLILRGLVPVRNNTIALAVLIFDCVVVGISAGCLRRIDDAIVKKVDDVLDVTRSLRRSYAADAAVHREKHARQLIGLLANKTSKLK